MPPAPAPESCCWEYRAIYLDRPGAVDDVDTLGEAGWELVSLAVAYAYFKRSTNLRPSRHRAGAAA